MAVIHKNDSDCDRSADLAFKANDARIVWMHDDLARIRLASGEICTVAEVNGMTVVICDQYRDIFPVTLDELEADPEWRGIVMAPECENCGGDCEVHEEKVFMLSLATMVAKFARMPIREKLGYLPRDVASKLGDGYRISDIRVESRFKFGMDATVGTSHCGWVEGVVHVLADYSDERIGRFYFDGYETDVEIEPVVSWKVSGS